MPKLPKNLRGNSQVWRRQHKRQVLNTKTRRSPPTYSVRRIMMLFSNVRYGALFSLSRFVRITSLVLSRFVRTRRMRTERLVLVLILMGPLMYESWACRDDARECGCGLKVPFEREAMKEGVCAPEARKRTPSGGDFENDSELEQGSFAVAPQMPSPSEVRPDHLTRLQRTWPYTCW